MAHVAKTYTSRQQRGLTPLRSVSKKIKRWNRQNKDLFKSMVASSIYKRENLKDRKLVKKWQIESVMTAIAMDMYKTYCGKISWGRIVQALKTGFSITDKPSSDKKDNLDYSFIGTIKIRTSEIEKYSKFLTSIK